MIANRNNPTALLYSAFGILKMDDKVKYQALTSFDDKKRLDALIIALKSKPLEVVLKNPSSLLKVHVPGGYNFPIFVLIVLVLAVLYMIEANYTENRQPGEVARTIAEDMFV